ncbi:Olfactory receptor 7A17 [Fukomys damarensis]|uniref:Olfactory receptor 7A17 n=1 Tax=Fukomys damarensis TaxID=885580 RepID=A0A091CX55_FUKDA|nr:Olfactory receptor 7A17 [Fukomys damarensis]
MPLHLWLARSFENQTLRSTKTANSHRDTTVSVALLRSVNNMKSENKSGSAKFVLLGLSDDPDLQPLVFGLFLSVYLVTVLGNLLIILAVSSDSHLHTPMYFFLSNLSFTDICFTSTTVPKMIADIHTHRRDISYVNCLTQMCPFIIFGCMDDLLLTVMAYDRYVAICHPLRCLAPHLHALRLSFCASLEIPHFFCELDHLLKLACSDVLINDILVYLLTGLGVYVSSTAAQSSRESAVASVLYTVVTPMMSPFIYSLRNKDMLRALGKLIPTITSFLSYVGCF